MTSFSTYFIYSPVPYSGSHQNRLLGTRSLTSTPLPGGGGMESPVVTDQSDLDTSVFKTPTASTHDPFVCTILPSSILNRNIPYTPQICSIVA